MTRDHHFFYDTSLGRGTVVYGQEGIKRHLLPTTAKNIVEKALISYDSKFLNEGRLRTLLESYFSGREINKWEAYLDTSGYSLFKLKVFETVGRISYGEVRSYKEVACEIGIPNGARAVGMAMRENRHPLLIPCHRVIASNKKLGGWSGPPELKSRLLSIEGNLVNEGMRISNELSF